MLLQRIAERSKSEFLKLASKLPYVDRKASAKYGTEWDHLNFKPRNAVIADYETSQICFPMIDLVLALGTNTLHVLSMKSCHLISPGS